ncbi:DEAD/DEAH box helicase [Marinobacter nauticus]|uniref:Superfamily I DNA and RNA helicases and helicase subunits-like n=1 Tax=Marinobacter nauticus (strain ATCC 700491 / DSM 11845 / VT8) TaxID=351348 RepID=A1U7Y1_MARN8|nr:DEAD/DEAH box helicase [Marinobacter nauticus]ABM21100.1 Superfamily I DNA and RNA helicases and helicase subunits-like [Marinobacter nauticus VT8]
MAKSIDQIVRYYSFCLTDAQAGRASITRASWHRLPYRRLSSSAIANGRLDDQAQNNSGDELSTLTRADVNAWSDSSTVWTPLVWHPFVFERISAVRHGIQTHQWAPDFLAPISILLYANRDGRVMVVGRPRFSRECLEPAAQGSVILGSVELADQFYDSNPIDEQLPPTHEDSFKPGTDDHPALTLPEAAEYARRLFEAVCQSDPHQPIPGVTYQKRAYGITLPARQGVGAVEPLLRTYDAIETLQPDLACLERVLSPLLGRPHVKPGCAEALPHSMTRWGTINGFRTLSDDQEDAVCAALHLQPGESLTIQGPPGTGKTAILQEMVASQVVESVLRSKKAPHIVIASTNNQALRNALQSFSTSRNGQPKDHTEALISRRWIDQWPSLGFYNAATQAASTARKEGLPTLEDMEALEQNVDLNALTMTFVQHARAVTRSDEIASIESATSALKALLKAEAKEQLWARALPDNLKRAAKASAIPTLLRHLKEHEQAWRRKGWLRDTGDIAAWQAIRSELSAAERAQRALADIQRQIKAIEKAASKHWEQDWGLKLIRPIRKSALGKRWAGRRMKGLLVDGEAMPTPTAALRELRAKQNEHQGTLREAVSNLIGGENMRRWEGAANRILNEKARGRWFWLALHVREGEWIAAMSERERSGAKDGRTREKVVAQLDRRFLLSPVMVATLHRLPKILSYWDIQRQAEIPLFEQTDLLIVDEAGQCAPDVAAASLSLTKRLVAIGDKEQLEPVWSLELREDLGNRVASDLIAPDQINAVESETITRSGGDVSSGSLLKLSERTTRYRSDAGGESGILLTQHRRCLPEIFTFCNELSYQGRLTSARIDDSICPLPPVGFIDCPGAERQQYGSRQNDFEAELIAQLVEEHAPKLRVAYNKDACETIAVVTPFKAQAELIDTALTKRLGRKHGITVGTVHSLQGAERPVIIFSVTYSAVPAGRTYFFDQSTSMLNVAVSRAQDSLIVVGDLDTLNHAGLPGRTLGEHLRKYGKRVPWPSMPTDQTGKETWLTSLRRVFGSNAIYKETESDNALIKALSERELGSVILVSSEMDRVGLQAAGNAMIKASRSGMRIQWLIPHDYLLSHKDSQVFMRAIETIRSNGIQVHYIGATFNNLLLLPEAGIGLWGESSWLSGEPPKRMATTQSNAAALWERLVELHNLRDQDGESAGRLTA